MLLFAIAWIDGAGLEFEARAMACCVHRQDCGGDIHAPDKCCERMGHAGPAKIGTVVQSSHTIALAPLAFAAPRLIVESAAIADQLGFTRAHDPPHLHTFALLI